MGEASGTRSLSGNLGFLPSSLMNMQITQVTGTPEVQVSLICLNNSGCR